MFSKHVNKGQNAHLRSASKSEKKPLTGSPGRPLGPTSPSSPWKQKKQQCLNDADAYGTRFKGWHYKIPSHDVIPALRPLPEVLRVPWFLCPPKSQTSVSSSLHGIIKWISSFSFFGSYISFIHQYTNCTTTLQIILTRNKKTKIYHILKTSYSKNEMLLDNHWIIVRSVLSHPVSFVARQTRKAIEATVTLGEAQNIQVLFVCSGGIYSGSAGFTWSTFTSF